MSLVKASPVPQSLDFSHGKSSGICFAVLSNGVSGTERIVFDLANFLTNPNSHERTQKTEEGKLPLFALIPEGTSLEAYTDRFRPLLQVEPLRLQPVIGRQLRWRNLLMVRAALRRWRPALIHFHCPHYLWGWETVWAARLAGVPFIVRTEQNPLMGLPPRSARLILPRVDEGVHCFTYVSIGNQERFERFLPYRKGRGIVINNGVALEQFTPVDSVSRESASERRRIRSEFGLPLNARIAVFVGQYGGRRPLLPIFEALKSLLTRPQTQQLAENWHLLIIGDGDPNEKQQAIQLGLQERVHFVGRRSNIAHVLPHCDLMVSASHFEGLSIAMLEAWACGLPILSFAVDGISDVLGIEETMRQMVPHEGGSEAYAEKWLLFMDEMNGEAKNGLVEGQFKCWREKQQSFSTDTMLRQYVNLYQTLLQKGTNKNPFDVKEMRERTYE